jgi:hypothetical protein
MKSGGNLRALVEHVRLASRALSELAGPALAVGPDLVEAIRVTREDMERRLYGDEIVIALAGEPIAQRSLLNAIVGARAFDPAAIAGAGVVVALRAARTFDYTAQMRLGHVVEFASRMPARDESFAEAQQHAEAERDTAEAAERDARDRLEEAQREAVEQTLELPPKTVAPVERWSFWQRLAGWVAHVARTFSGWHPRLIGSPAGWNAGLARFAREREISALEHGVDEARSGRENALARLEGLRTERPMHEQRRAEAFLAEVRALTDVRECGKGVLSLSVACPTPHLPDDVTLVASDVPRLADAVLYVVGADSEPESERIAVLTKLVRPARVHVVRKLGELARVFDAVRSERPAVAAAHAAAAARSCIVRVAEEGARAEATCKRRIAAIESQRMPDPAEFRAQQLERIGPSVQEGAREVQTAMLERWRTAILCTREEWRTGLQACSTRRQVQAFARTIHKTAHARLQAAVDDVASSGVVDLQRVSESIQTWFLEEVRARYHVARRIEAGDAPATVIPADIEVDPLDRPPLASALDRFEARRVKLGLGGVAAGALVGTLVVPGIGTAIGAFVGVFAGWLKRIEPLKQECLARLERCLDDVERSVAEQIENRQACLADELRTSLEVAFDFALEQLDSSIARLMALECRVLETERQRSEDLAQLRSTLQKNVERIATPLPTRSPWAQ